MHTYLSNAFVYGQASRTCRNVPTAASLKSWASGDATSRGVRLADIAMRGEMGIPGVLTAPQWGFYDVLFSKTNRDQALKPRSEEHTSELQSRENLVCRLLLDKKKANAAARHVTP